MRTKYIIFTADVYPVQASKLREAITKSVSDGFDHLYFLISSGGGNVFEGISLAAYIKALPMKTTMHNIGQIDSVANVIFAAGKERVCSKNASFLFHGVSMNLEKSGYLEQQLRELYEQSKRLKNDIAKGVSEYTGISLSDIQALMIDGGVILSAEEAKAKGFITNIVEPNIPANTDITSIGNA